MCPPFSVARTDVCMGHRVGAVSRCLGVSSSSPDHAWLAIVAQTERTTHAGKFLALHVESKGQNNLFWSLVHEAWHIVVVLV